MWMVLFTTLFIFFPFSSVLWWSKYRDFEYLWIHFNSFIMWAWTHRDMPASMCTFICKYSLRPSSSSCWYLSSWGCMLLITVNNDWTEESLAIGRPLWELLRIRFTKISRLLCRAAKNCAFSDSDCSPFCNGCSKTAWDCFNKKRERGREII